MSQKKPKISNGTTIDKENQMILLKERYDLLKWTRNVEMRTPSLLIPVQIANYIESLPFCKMAISPKCDRIALMSHSRLLDIYALNGEILHQESSVNVLEEASPEYCLLQFTSSGSLILSSRSTPHIDVFDNMGAFCYDIPIEAHEGVFDLNQAICGMQTLPNNSISSNDKYTEILYVLQYSGVFSVFKIGRLSKYTKMWSVQLDIGQTGSFTVLPQFNVLLVSAHYKESTTVSPPAGLCSFRIIDSDPYVEPIRVLQQENGWWSQLPFSTSFSSYLPKLSLSFDSDLAIAVATSGSLYIFEFSFIYINGPRPMEACFVDTDEVAIIFDTGYLLRCSTEELEEKLYSMKIKDKKQLDEEPESKDMYHRHTVMSSPSQREIFLLSADGDSAVLREAAHKRVQLAGQIWISTVWNSFKKLVGMAMGEPAEQLQMATHIARFEFALIHAPTRTLQELFERTLIEHDYVRAKELAEQYESIDVNIVLKAEWLDKCSKSTLVVEDVDNILKLITDTAWVVEQCATVEFDDFDVLKALIELGLSIPETSITWQIRLLHHLRILEVCRINEDIETYLKSRRGSCLEAALTFANNGDMESLFLIVEANQSMMKKYQKKILSGIPSCLFPTKYEHFMPKIDTNGILIEWEIEDSSSETTERFNRILKDHPDAENLIQSLNGANIEEEEHFDYVQWVRETLKKIDFECGLTNNCISLLKIGIERGFKELEEDIVKWQLYSTYISICSTTVESIHSFEDSSVDSFINLFSKLLESELIQFASDIIALITWKVRSTQTENIDEYLQNKMITLMTRTNERSTKVLVAFREVDTDIINDTVILETLLNMTSTGSELLQSLGNLPVDKYVNVTSSLSSLMSRGVKMTFKSIFESMKEPDGARRVLIKLSRSGHCSTIEDWVSLRDDVVEMALSIYGDFITKEEALELVAQEILEEEQIGQRTELMSLVLTLSSKQQHGDDENRLGVEKSGQVLLAKSDELMSEATHKDDPLLGKARFFAVAARSISPDVAKEKLKWLDAIELAQELGCTMMPIAIKHSDHDSLLNDIVHIGNNYKQGKKLAKLALLLDIDTPVATALSYCALAALNANDAVYLSKYIGEVISKARGIPVVHHLCMKIMKSSHVPTDMEDIYACAMMNCSDENILETVDAIVDSQNNIEQNRKTKEVDMNDVPVCDKLATDPMYATATTFNGFCDQEMNEKIGKMIREGKNVGLEELKKLTAHQSSSLAMCLSLMDESNENEDISWTMNDKLRRYEKSLRFFKDRIPLSLLISVPPANLIAAANQTDNSITAIDRVEDYGCNRTRFLSDSVYREDAIVGLAMTENDKQFEDAVELAKMYEVDEWQLHWTSLENALTSLSIDEVKRILKTRGHLPKLRERLDEFHSSLRSSVFPLLGTNQQFIAYSTLFAESEPEKKTLKVVKTILDKTKNVKGTKLWSDPNCLSSALLSIPDKYLWNIIDNILLIPIGIQACEKAARLLIDGNENRPPTNPFTLYLLLRKDVDEFLELVAVKSRDEEIEYLERAVILLEPIEIVPKELIDAVRERVERMKRCTITPEEQNTDPSNGYGNTFTPSFNNDSTGMMKRRNK